jgi:hypothetical protein
MMTTPKSWRPTGLRCGFPLIGFLTTLVLAVVLMNELMPRGLADWQRASMNGLVVVGFRIVMAWIGACAGYASRAKGIQLNH